jgi:RNA polymerase sigma factor (sigma-70 family)
MDDTTSGITEELLAQAAWARGLARRLVAGEARADDVLQQAWLAALKRRRDAIQSSARGWFGGVLRHVAAKQQREGARRDVRERAAALPEAQPATSDHVAELEAQRLVVDALLRIEEPYRETLVRRWYRDEKPAAIARAMGVPVKTADTRLARGLERLRAELTALRGGVARDGLLALLPLAASAPAPWVVLGSLAGGGVTVGAFMKFAAAGIAVSALAWWGTSRGGDEAGRDAKRLGETAAHPAATAAPGAASAGEATRAEDGATRAGAAAATAPAMLVVHVFDDAGRAVEGGTAKLFDGGTELDEAYAFGGAVHLQSPSSAAHLLFIPIIPHVQGSHASAPACFDVPAHASELEIRLPRAAVLAGRVECDGRSPGCGVVLTFRAKAPLPGFRDIFRDVAKEVRGMWTPTDVAVTCDDDGNFRIAGLDPAGSGWLCVDQRFSTQPIRRTSEGAFHKLDSVWVAAPIEGMRLEIYSAPALVGRLVDRSGAPQSWQEIRATYERGGTVSDREAALRGEAGRFRFHLPFAGADAVDLQVDGADVAGSAFVHVAGPFVGTRELGDVVLAPERTIRWRIVAPGQPAVVNGSALLLGAGGARRFFEWSEREIEFDVAQPFTRARFAAAGRMPVEVELPAASTGTPIDVVFEHATRLDITTERTAAQAELDSVAQPRATIEVAVRGPLFDPRFDRELADRCENTSCEVDTDGEPGWTIASSSSRGITLAGVRAGTPLRVRAVGATGATIAEREVELAPGETRQVALPLGDRVRRLAARVVDSVGRPIEDASVSVQRIREDGRHGGTGTSTDSDGRVRFAEYFEEEVAVAIEADGFVPLRRSPVRTGGEGVLEFRLERCWPLAVDVVDPAGQRVDPDLVDAVASAALGSPQPPRFGSKRGADDAYVLQALPATPVRVRARVGGRDYFADAAPPQPRARVVVPAHGAVDVRYVLPLAEHATRGELLGAVELAPLDARGAAVAASPILFSPQRPTGGVAFTAVLPGRYEAVLIWHGEQGGELRREPTGIEFDVAANATSEVAIGK